MCRDAGVFCGPAEGPADECVHNLEAVVGGFAVRGARNRARVEPDAAAPLDDAAPMGAAKIDPYRQRLQRELDEMDA